MIRVTVTADHYGTTWSKTFWFWFRATRYAAIFEAVPEHYVVSVES